MKSSKMLHVSLILCLGLHLAMSVSHLVQAESNVPATTTTVLSSKTTVSPTTTLTTTVSSDKTTAAPTPTLSDYSTVAPTTTAMLSSATTVSSPVTTEPITTKQLLLEDDSRAMKWIRHQNLYVGKTFFVSDIDGKTLHESVDGYQTPYKFDGYIYLSTTLTWSDSGQAVGHIYHDINKVDQSITKTRYIDGMTGKKIQEDRAGQVFISHFGAAKIYNAFVYEENGEKIYLLSYLTDEDYIQYAGHQYYPRLTDYTKYIDQDSGEEIAPRQDGFVPGIPDIAGYTYVSSEFSEQDGKSYFVLRYQKENSPVPTTAITAPAAKNRVLPNTGSTDNPLWRIVSVVVLIIGSGFILVVQQKHQ
ncbi:LPXTG cell wall anchor domain-containing protein [Streptococcus ovis]|uniref:LPXTG cell wall anchor domain-containing protein n=1 Tax=Streptococcus ovis TaxID=82806 RepID=UPI000368A471|nr:LPXTG cell wall anchor domain-containing protein [Streptococcus ovis]